VTTSSVHLARAAAPCIILNQEPPWPSPSTVAKAKVDRTDRLCALCTCWET
jgi:hypothetical protein